MRNPIPNFTREQIDQYVKTGQPVGDFLWAVLTNNLLDTFRRADDGNLNALVAIVTYLYQNVPSECWGSPENVSNWIAREGLEGIEWLRAKGVSP